MKPEHINSPNFGFLASYDIQLVRLGALAERYFKEDPNTTILKLRQFGETLAQLLAAKAGLFKKPEEVQSDLLRRLKVEGITPNEVSSLFHHLRIVGNRASHGNEGTHGEALTALKVSRELGIWFHRSFGPNRKFSPGPFVPPPDPSDATKEIAEELEKLRAALDETRSDAERAKAKIEEEARARLSAEERARKEAEDRTIWEKLAEEAENAKTELIKQFNALQAAAKPQETAVIIQAAAEAATEIYLDEAATRELIDTQLRDRGWEVDTKNLRHSLGVRPAKGRYMAIAEWPTASGPADYALFIGTECFAVVEAKRKRKNVSAAVDQAERYAKGIAMSESLTFPDGGPWGDYKGICCKKIFWPHSIVLIN